MKYLSRFILKIFGWKATTKVSEPPKSVLCVVPHTSNWDFIVGKLVYWAIGRKSGFLIKKSWYTFPLNYLFDAMGGVPIDRRKSMSVTQQMIDSFEGKDYFHLAITPEGTRSKTTRWKLGFYHIACGANVPIQLAYIDYEKREMSIDEVFYPTGDRKSDLNHIYDFYRNKTTNYPKKFAIPQNIE